MTALPLALPDRLFHVPYTAHVLSAYDICLTLEAKLQKSLQVAIEASQAKVIGNRLIYIRILGYLIRYVPTDQGLKTVVEETISCHEDSALLAVGKMYYDHYIRAFRSNKGRTPIPSNHASRPSFDTIADMMSDTLERAPQDHKDAKKKALYRDGFRCVVTGYYDKRSTMEIQEVADKVMADPTLDREWTQCAHIFSESTNADIELGSPKRDYAATMWAVMQRFGYENLPDELNGPLVHRLENVMTLVPTLHMDFDQLMIWFVPTGEENKYKLEARNPLDIRRYQEYVTFTTPDPVKFPVPSRTYLAIHAACAKVAHLSGAAESIDKFDREFEDGKTLDLDGSSANMLEYALSERLHAYAIIA